MPEGPELHLAGRFVNKLCQGRLFTGKVVKSEVSTKNPDVEWDEEAYTISATSRGKELKLTLAAENQGADKKKKQGIARKTLDIIFRFGMSGKFAYDSADEMQKHAHLNFFTKEGGMVLSFVDYRRFGKWEPAGDWGAERGPCVLLEYAQFRENVLKNLKMAAFNKPICEALLNQKFFNGIGNYLRAEILYRCKVAPFQCARSVLEPLAEQAGVKSEPGSDILELCHTLPTEVINLSGGVGYDPEAEKDYSAFSDWLQCYYNPSMCNMVDHNKRTIWFQGEAGPMVPNDAKSRGRKTKSKSNKKGKEEKISTEESSTDQEKTPKKTPKKTRARVKAQVQEDQEEVKVKVEKVRKAKVTGKASKRKLNVDNTVKVEQNGHSPLKTRRQRSLLNGVDSKDSVLSQSAHDFPSKAQVKVEKGGLMSPYFAESVSQGKGRRRKGKAKQ